MQRFAFLVPAAAVFAMVCAAQSASNVTSSGAVMWDSCGGEDQPACLPGSPGYRVTPGFLPTRCDLTLDLSFENSEWICRDKGRRRTIPDLAYTQNKAPIAQSTFFQQSDQLGRISADLPLNYVPIIGTHNSYSNYKDGSENVFNADQLHTITDQLQLGARHLRLDPIGRASDGSPILCHISPLSSGLSKFFAALKLPSNESEFCATALFGKALSYQRPFYYAVRELNKWLERHPGEVVILRIHYVGSSVSKREISQVVVHELQGKLLQVPDDAHVPTMRQMRSMGKQVIAISSTEPFSDYVFKDPEHASMSWANSTSNPSYPLCVSQTGNPIGLNRAFQAGGDPVWGNIGEDRAEAMAYVDEVERGVLDVVETEIGVQCGYTLLGFDFFHALPYAAKGSLPFGATIDFTGPSPDPRPQAAIWSWRAGTLLTVPMPAALSKPAVPVWTNFVNLADYRSIRWEPVAEQTALPYACAGPAEDENPRRYAWKITKTAGAWGAGEAECQKLGETYHFWRPMSAVENQELVRYLKASPSQRVWVNHYSGKTTALPASVNLVYNRAGGTMTGASVVMGSGIGGGFTLTFQPAAGAPNFLQAPATADKPVIALQPNAAVAAGLAPGVYSGTLTIDESAGYLRGSAQVTVSLRVN